MLAAGVVAIMKKKLTIRNCPTTFRFQCPRLWDELAETHSPDVRHCAQCDQDVYLCTTAAETTKHAKAGHCIARQIPDGKTPPMLGRPQYVPTGSIKTVNLDRPCPRCSYPVSQWRSS